MSANRISVLVVALAMTVPASARAQQEPGVRPGDRVRLTAPALGLDRFEGTLAALEAEPRTLTVEAEDTTVTVPIDALTRLDVSRGKASRAAGLLAGAAAGALLGAVIGSSLGEEDCPPESFAPCADKGDTALIGGVLGGAVGAGIGYRVTGGTRWVPLSLQSLEVSIHPFRSGRPAFLAAIRF